MINQAMKNDQLTYDIHKIGKNISHMNQMKSDTNAKLKKLGTIRKPGVVWCSVRGGVVLEMVWCRYRLG